MMLVAMLQPKGSVMWSLSAATGPVRYTIAWTTMPTNAIMATAVLDLPRALSGGALMPMGSQGKVSLTPDLPVASQPRMRRSSRMPMTGN